MTTVSKELVKDLAQYQGRKPLPQLPKGEFSIISIANFQIAVFQYDSTSTTGCSGTTSVQHKNLPPTTVPAPPSSVTLPAAAHVIPILQVGSMILFRIWTCKMAAVNWALMFCAILQPTVAAGVRKLSRRVKMRSEMSGDSCVVMASGVSMDSSSLVALFR